MTRFFAAWNSVKNIQGFTTTGSGTNTTPLDAPASLPPAGVATADEALDYYVRFTTFDGGTTLTLDGNQLFALESYSFGATEPLSGVLSSGKVAFNALHLSFGDAALDPRLFVQLASETALMEVDILGYRPSDGALISDNSFGLVEGASLTIDQSGVAQYSAQYGSAELQHYSTLPGGAPIADSSAAWNSVKNIQGFSADGTNTSTPVAAPTTLPATGVAPAAAEDLDYYVRFTAYNGATLTLDGNQLFALASYSFGATTPLDGLQPSGHVAFNALQLSFGDAALNPSLFALLASGTAIKEIDVLGYRADGALISDNNFGLLVGTSLTIDQSGVAQYAAQFGSVELQHYSALPDGSLVADGPAAWNSLQNDQTFSTSGSGASTTPLAAPATLPAAGVATTPAETLDYYVRFTTFDGTTLTLDDNQLFAIERYSFGATQSVSIGGQVNARVAFNALQLSLGDAVLNPRLFALLASGTGIKEVDVLGYRPSDGALVSDNSFGLLAGANLTIDQSGVAHYSAQYGSAELQYYTADNNPPCYCRGTRILTARGQVAVEDLVIGDRAVTASGSLRPITWLGHRGIDITRHPDPQAVWPICVSAGAFAPNKPERDLWLSPGHNIAAEDVLMPANLLVNRISVVQHKRSSVEYWHVELDRHDIILAEGLEAESYLDTGSRTAFVNGGDFIEAHPDFAPKHWAETCLPLLHEGPEITRTKALLIERTSEFGCTVTAEADLHILADGTRIEPIRLSGNRVAFMPSAGCREILLSSRSFVPAHTCPGSQDGRTLGIDVRRLAINGEEIALDAALLSGGGWNEPEREGNLVHRWTTGQAQLPAGTRLILLDLNGRGYYWTMRSENVVPMFGQRTERRLTS